MQINPYQSPCEVGYGPPRIRSRWWDFVACVTTALLIFAVLEGVVLAAAHAYQKLGLDWSREFQIVRQIIVYATLVTYAVLFALMWRRETRQRQSS
jgi:hypothetical protein